MDFLIHKKLIMSLPLFAGADDVRRLMSTIDVRAALSGMFAALGRGAAIQPPQMLTPFPARAGDVITYQGVLADARVFGAKLSPYIAASEATGERAIVTAWTMLMSMDSGQPLLCCDAAQLTTERTAGATALAIDLLAPRAAQTLALVGSGPVALAHLRHALALRPWSGVRVYSPALAHDSARREAILALAQPGLVSIAASAAQCVRGADVAMLCTSSGTPVIGMADVDKPMLVTSVSTNAARAHEIPPALLPHMDVYCDYRRTTPAVAGEMTLAAEHHGWSAEQVAGDLPGLVLGECPLPQYRRPVFFRSVGLGLEDIALAHALYRQLATLR